LQCIAGVCLEGNCIGREKNWCSFHVGPKAYLFVKLKTVTGSITVLNCWHSERFTLSIS
jgi:hypothetical protein